MPLVKLQQTGYNYAENKRNKYSTIYDKEHLDALRKKR